MPARTRDGDTRARRVAALVFVAVALPLAAACGSSHAASKPTATPSVAATASSARARAFADRTPRPALETAIAEGTRPATGARFGIGFGGNIVGTVSAFLSITPAQLQSELAAPGATLATVSAAHGKDRDALKQALTSAMQQRLNTAVANRTITQAASAQSLTQFQSRLDALVDSKGATGMRPFRTPTPAPGT